MENIVKGINDDRSNSWYCRYCGYNYKYHCNYNQYPTNS